jgi:hypothetical protein
VNLDEIPKYSKARSLSDECERAAQLSHDNLLKMKEAGLSPIPVFHQYEHFRWLEKMQAEGEIYVGLSPKEGEDRYNIASWLDICFDILKGTEIKTHAFGLTAPDLLREFPFMSADSATWREVTTKGKIFAPQSKRMDDYGLYGQFFVTHDTRGEPTHIDALPPSQIDFIDHYLRENVGTHLGYVRNDPKTIDRLRTGIAYFQDLEVLSGVKIYFATNTGTHQKSLLDEYGVENRLLSYAELRGGKKGQHKLLERYVYQGPPRWTRRYREHRGRAVIEKLEEYDRKDPLERKHDEQDERRSIAKEIEMEEKRRGKT